MSLNRTLDRLFDEIRREAKRNPDFADRLDAVIRAHDSRREVAEEVLAEAARDETPPAPAPKARAKPTPQRPEAGPQAGAPRTPPINPAGLYKKGGEEALRKALSEQDLGGLRALVAEHNLDPGGVTAALTRDELAAHVVAQAKRRAERDDKMFDY